MPSLRKRFSGFTIVELLVVIGVVGILATIAVVSYNGWRNSIAVSQVKSDLKQAAAAMQSAVTFNDIYPSSIPNSFSASEGVTITLTEQSDTTFCIDGTSDFDLSIAFYIDQTLIDSDPGEGPCATRPGLLVPSIPTNLAIVSSPGTQVNLSWTAVGGANPASSYTLQCASDAAFIVGLQETVISNGTTTTGSVNNLTISSTFYCRIRAANNSGTSAWSSSVNTTTDNSYGSLAVATSIEGYWTSAPTGFLLEDGSAVSRTTYADLFAVIGTTYGAGDGSTTFNLPDSRGRVSVNKSSTDTEFDTMGEKPGSKTETLTVAQMPSHTHTQNAHTHTQDAHTNTLTDPGHNHSQNAHNHTQNAHNHNGGAANPYVSDGSFGSIMVTSQNGSAFGFKYAGTNPSATGANQSTTATNSASTTGHSVSAATATNQSTTATNQSTSGGATHNNIQPSIVKTFAIKFSPIDAAATTLPEGSSVNGYWTSAPTGFLLEDGSAVSRSTYASLFAVIGTTYGAGDGSTTFNLPDSRGRVSVNRNPSDVEFDTIGEKYGEKAHTLTTTEIPSHTHTQNSHTHTQNSSTHSVTNPGHNHTQNAHNHTQNAHDHNLGFEHPYVNDNSFGGLAVTSQNGSAFGFRLGQAASTVATNQATTATNQTSTTGLGLYATTATNQSTSAVNQNTGGGGFHNEIQPSIVRVSAIKVTPVSTSGTNLASGTSLGGYWTSVPTGYLLEDGQSVSKITYPDLWAKIGYTYGGSGNSFNIPDSRGRVAVNKSADTEFNTVGKKYGIKTEILTIAQLASHTHTQNAHTHIQNAHTHSVYDPGHNHTQNAHTHTQASHVHGSGYVSDGSFGGTAVTTQNGTAYGFYIGKAPSVTPVNNATTATNNGTSSTNVTVNSITATNQSSTATNQNTGGGGAHNNIQPSIVKIFVIKI